MLKKVFFKNFTSCFAFRGPNGRVRIHFLSLGSYLNMYHGYASLKKEHFLPVFTEKEHFTAYFEGREKH